MIIKTKCPYCGLQIEIDDATYVEHQLPPCKEYTNSVDALEFITKVNKFLKASA